MPELELPTFIVSSPLEPLPSTLAVTIEIAPVWRFDVPLSIEMLPPVEVVVNPAANLILPAVFTAFPEDSKTSCAPNRALPNEMSPVAATLDTPVEMSIWLLADSFELESMVICPVEKLAQYFACIPGARCCTHSQRRHEACPAATLVVLFGRFQTPHDIAALKPCIDSFR